VSGWLSAHGLGEAFGPWIGHDGSRPGGYLLSWPMATRRWPNWPVPASAAGVVTVARVGAGGQGSPTGLVQRGRQHEYEDGEGWSPGKKDGGTAHQGGLGANEVVDGATRQHFFEGGGTVEAEGLTGIRPEKSSLASTWRSGRRRAPTQCSSM
jgi:hypothetical protein